MQCLKKGAININIYCTGVFKEMDLAVDTIIKLTNTLSEDDLNSRPTEGKWSIGELLTHVSSM